MPASLPLQNYQNHLGYELNYRLHLPDNPQYPLNLVIGCPGFGGHKKSVINTCSREALLATGRAVMDMDITPVTPDPTGRHDYADTSKLTPSYYVQTLHSALSNVVREYGTGDNPLIKTSLSLIAPSYAGRATMDYVSHKGDRKNRIIQDDPVDIKSITTLNPVIDPLNHFRWPILINQLTGNSWKARGMFHTDIVGSRQAIPYGIYEECHKTDFCRDIAPFVTCGVQIVSGAKDRLAPVPAMKKLHDSLTGAAYKEWHLIDNAGHYFEDITRVGALKKKSDRDIAKMMKECGETKKESKETKIMNYIIENFTEMTRLKDVVSLSTAFLDRAFMDKDTGIVIDILNDHDPNAPQQLRSA